MKSGSDCSRQWWDVLWLLKSGYYIS